MYYLYSSTIHPVFQLTTSRGGRRGCRRFFRSRITFQLTTSRGGRRIPITLYPAISVFQLTTSRRGRPLQLHLLHIDLIYFNSRPHEEVDVSCISAGHYQSLFQLTTSRRGRQSSPCDAWICFLISTHDLTKRSTS